MEPDYSDEEMNSKEKEVSDVLLRISEFNVSEVNIAIDNVTQYDECFRLALKFSKKLNKISFRDMQQHIKSKEEEVQILKERLVAIGKLVTTNSEKLVLEIEEKTGTLEIEEFPEIQNEKVISPTNENREETDEPTLVEKKKKKRVPPIMIDESLNTPALLDEISAIVGVKIQTRMTNGKLKVFPESIDAHRKIQNFISVKKLKSHTFEMQNQKQLKVIIRGLPIYYNQEEIKNQGPIPEHISLLKSRRTNTNMPLFLVVLNKNPVKAPVATPPRISPSNGNPMELRT
ncbi:uncharacterized protein NPIL_606881 [Nephila pilipes]|uniref:Uncharacterized protein n=1 Tax=Nephila pilipes TaxID=299642 RepID=A0A8X6UI84_NEPPI|nr:uncharacterized protein NPIL_606881 [Nephila pilipes]